MEEENKKWYPLYTKSRFEKKAYHHLINAGYEAYLPLQKKLHKWSDRNKIVEVPLFSSYVFVRISPNQIRDVLTIYGVVRYIFFNGRPASARDEEIELIKSLIDKGVDIDVFDGNLDVGKEVTISSGILKGYSGKIHSIKGNNKLIIEIESINKSLLITLDKNYII